MEIRVVIVKWPDQGSWSQNMFWGITKHAVKYYIYTVYICLNDCLCYVIHFVIILYQKYTTLNTYYLLKWGYIFSVITFIPFNFPIASFPITFSTRRLDHALWIRGRWFQNKYVDFYQFIYQSEFGSLTVCPRSIGLQHIK